MLSGLSIRNVVLIEALDLDLKAGLTALTGETGAGKSIILDSLGMATGARSDRGLVRSGTDKAQCTATFEVSSNHRVWDILGEAGLDTDERDLVVLRRVINQHGRRRAGGRRFPDHRAGVGDDIHPADELPRVWPVGDLRDRPPIRRCRCLAGSDRGRNSDPPRPAGPCG